MFRCDGCGRKSKRGEKQSRIVVEERIRRSDQGREIVRELKVGSCCRSKSVGELLHPRPRQSEPNVQNVNPPKAVQRRLTSFLMSEVARRS